MKKKLIFFLGLILLTSSVFAEGSLTLKDNYNPDGRIGSIVLNCSGGIHTGKGDSQVDETKYSHSLNLSGYNFTIGLLSPVSKSTSLTFSISLDKRNTSITESDYYLRDELSSFTIIGGFKFYLKP
jgi:hypothetical protein